MKQNDRLHGFVVEYAQPLPELKATLYRMTYEKNGADLVWLDREDENKTFAITFKTIPQDDTGVFHILEHSVLCGSDKYPVKEPFVELLKSSLQTFLNAFTFPDKTCYPVCSRNDRDFLNLIDVYIDAVLHPLSVTDDHAFRQEGWHYELEEPQGELTVNGVVYNEMKGAYADPDTVLMREMNALLFPDNCYGYESGGYPDAIPTLTYESYRASHRRFYHPSNARIFLDGSIELDAVLAKLDSFLSAYDRLEVDADIPMQSPVSPADRTVRYQVGPEDDGENKAILARGWVFGRFDEREKITACEALTDALCGSNEAPLKKALLEQGLAEDVEFQSWDGIQQRYVLLVVRHTDERRQAQVWQTVERVLREQADGGLDRSRVASILNRMEFKARERDMGGFPKGLALALDCAESWLYGGDPAQNLQCGALYASLREKLAQGYFEDFIRSGLLECPHQAAVCLLPSATLGEEKARRERERLAAVKAGWTEEETQTVIDRFCRLRERQGTPDSPQALAAIPTLSLADISPRLHRTPQEVTSVDGVTVLHQPLETGGILYLDLYFSLADLTLEELSRVSLLTSLLGRLDTAHYSAIDLRSAIDDCLGRFSATVLPLAPEGERERCTPWLVVSASLLTGRRADAARLLLEMLTAVRFDDSAKLGILVTQLRLQLEQGIQASGHSFAAQRAGAYLSAQKTAVEAVSGIDYLRFLQQTERAQDGLGDTLAGLFGRVFSRQRLTVSVTGELDTDWVRTLAAGLPDLPVGEPAACPCRPLAREGFLIPAEVSFAAKAGSLPGAGRCTGSDLVGANLLTYDYLWNTVRVQGGAYGVGLRADSDGSVRFWSYRDPSPRQSLNRFNGAGQALIQTARSGDDLTKYIVSTVGGDQPPLSARTEGFQAAAHRLSGDTWERRQQRYTEILHTTPAQLEALGASLTAAAENAGICVIGGSAALDACGDVLERRESLL
ncbi:MAG: insulinase family protein [Clostridiales bacterium]|nr:insulinase family protein [Clostridiales bacterium]